MEVYIVLTDTGTFLTKMIKLFTRHSLNHASISFTKELDFTYSFGRKNASNPFNGGFVKENMKGQLFQHAPCAIYKRTVSEHEYKQMLEVVRKIEIQRSHYKYNFIGLFGVLLKKKINRKRAFFCSEFVATVLNNGGIPVFGKPACFVTPNDLIISQDFHLVFEGQLHSYLIQYFKEEEMKIVKYGREGNRLFRINSNYQKLIKSNGG